MMGNQKKKKQICKIAAVQPSDAPSSAPSNLKKSASDIALGRMQQLVMLQVVRELSRNWIEIHNPSPPL
jgi:hypothetical protein